MAQLPSLSWAVAPNPSALERALGIVRHVCQHAARHTQTNSKETKLARRRVLTARKDSTEGGPQDAPSSNPAACARFATEMHRATHVHPPIINRVVTQKVRLQLSHSHSLLSLCASLRSFVAGGACEAGSLAILHAPRRLRPVSSANALEPCGAEDEASRPPRTLRSATTSPFAHAPRGSRTCVQRVECVESEVKARAADLHARLPRGAQYKCAGLRRWMCGPQRCLDAANRSAPATAARHLRAACVRRVSNAAERLARVFGC
ncbi:hypothetical protein DFH06DRAFT_1390510 [Mycena polygramma]|nr:hypothetical protein DFH06DRAFT_1390510 [Mycena polygramma]